MAGSTRESLCARIKSRLVEQGVGAAAESSAFDCDARCVELRRMLNVKALQTPMEPLELPAARETHQNALLKEMAWMAADFRVERQIPVQFHCHLRVRYATGKRHSNMRKGRSKVWFPKMAFRHLVPNRPLFSISKTCMAGV